MWRTRKTAGEAAQGTSPGRTWLRWSGSLRSLPGTSEKSWTERQEQTELEKARYAAFGEKFDWGEDQGKVEREGVVTVTHRKLEVEKAHLPTNLWKYL